MKRNEFKLLMEDWKKNFAVEGEVVSSTLNEGYTELDRAILEEGIKDMPIVKTAIGLFGAAAILALVNMPDGLKTIKQMVDSYGQPPSITRQYDLSSDKDQDSYDPAKHEFFRVGDKYRKCLDDYKEEFNTIDEQQGNQGPFNKLEEAWKATNKEYYDKPKWFAKNAKKYVLKLQKQCTIPDLAALPLEDKERLAIDKGISLEDIDLHQAGLQALFYLAEKSVTEGQYNNTVEQYLKLNQLN